MGKLIKELHSLFSNDETLLRYLHYRHDDPLNSDLPDILSQSTYKQEIVDNVIIPSSKVNLDIDEKKCLVSFYSAAFNPLEGNHMYTAQNIEINIYVHDELQTSLMRLDDIIARVRGLIFNRQFKTGMGKLKFLGGESINDVDNYVGLKLTYEALRINKSV